MRFETRCFMFYAELINGVLQSFSVLLGGHQPKRKIILLHLIRPFHHCGRLLSSLKCRMWPQSQMIKQCLGSSHCPPAKVTPSPSPFLGLFFKITCPSVVRPQFYKRCSISCYALVHLKKEVQKKPSSKH